MCNDVGEGSRCCAAYSIVGAIFTVSWRSKMKIVGRSTEASFDGEDGDSALFFQRFGRSRGDL